MCVCYCSKLCCTKVTLTNSNEYYRGSCRALPYCSTAAAVVDGSGADCDPSLLLLSTVGYKIDRPLGPSRDRHTSNSDMTNRLLLFQLQQQWPPVMTKAKRAEMVTS